MFEASDADLKAAPCDHGLRTLRITRALELADLALAQSEMRAGLKCFPRDAGMQTLRARLLYDQNQKQIARLVLDDVIRSTPDAVGALKMSARWAFAEKDYPRAARDAERLLNFIHAPDDVLFAVDIAKSQKKAAKGFAILDRALKTQELDVYRVTAFDWAMSLGDPARALTYVPASLPNNALGATWWMRRGDAHALAKELGQARTSFAKAQMLLDGLRPHVKKRAAIVKLNQSLALKQEAL